MSTQYQVISLSGMTYRCSYSHISDVLLTDCIFVLILMFTYS